MSPARKRPTCRACGSPMAGHKRPNGVLVCPNPIIHEVGDPDCDTKPDSSTSAHGCQPLNLSPTPTPCSPSPPALRREQSIILPAHYVNPNFVESPRAAFRGSVGVVGPVPPLTRRPLDRAGTPNTWVSTEPADDIPVKREPGVFETFDPAETGEVDDGLFPLQSSASTSTPGPSTVHITTTNNNDASSISSAGLRRTFTNLLRNSRPVASLFSTPREEVDDIAAEARRNGLYTGLIHRPHSHPPRTPVKEETRVPGGIPRTPGAGARGVGVGVGGLERASSWWLVLGHSAEAVGHLLDLQDRGTRARYGWSSSSPPASPTSASPLSPLGVGVGIGVGVETMEPTVSAGVGSLPPLDKLSVRNSYLDLIIASSIGAFFMFYLLAL